MKVNQRLIVVLLVMIFIVALIFLYMNLSKQTTARTAAQQNLTLANATLAKSTADKKTAGEQLSLANSAVNQLQNQLSQAQQSLDSKKTTFPASSDSVDIDEILFDTARRFNVSVLSINTDTVEDSKVDKISFATASFQVSIKGNMADVINFLYALATESPFDHATIKTLGINTNEETVTTTAEDGTETETTLTYERMDVQITLYTFRG